jgi:hypothetical protein
VDGALLGAGSLWHAYLKTCGRSVLFFTRIKSFQKEMERWSGVGPQHIHHVKMEEVKNRGICFSC